MSKKIILASRSLRRKELLGQIGVSFTVQESKYQEDMTTHRNPGQLVKYLALKKAQNVARNKTNSVVIGADTVVVHNGKILGKPNNMTDAKRMLKRLSGQEHKVFTGYALIDTRSGRTFNKYSKAVVKFYNLSDSTINRYIKTKESLDKAGSYGIQGQGAILIKEIRGDYYSVVGLPISKIYQDFEKIGIIR